jgi:hypothetical protein
VLSQEKSAQKSWSRQKFQSKIQKISFSLIDSVILKLTETVSLVPSRFAHFAVRNRGYATSQDMEGLQCYFAFVSIWEHDQQYLNRINSK